MACRYSFPIDEPAAGWSAVPVMEYGKLAKEKKKRGEERMKNASRPPSVQ
jgi:hypothetical protein